MASESMDFDFDALVRAIQHLDDHFSTNASRAVNVSLTLRNWLAGFYIQEYEQNGSDRAEYGEELLQCLAERLGQQGLRRVDVRELRRYRSFYQAYPQIRETVSPELRNQLKYKALRLADKKRETASPEFALDGRTLVSKLSFSHLAELLLLEDPLQRGFYELECIRGNWSVRELRRQIASLYYERSGLSKDKDRLAQLVQSASEQDEPRLAIRDPFVFEFLGLQPKEVMSETALEDALLDKLQDFLLELGHGFCFEARQKRIIIGERPCFIDLVFYHRVLKCHVLVELKVDEFNHENIGQLNTYVSWYRRNVMLEGDNYPVGLLLCTGKDHALVEYALAGMDNQLFVSRYQLELPRKEDIEAFLREQLYKQLDEREYTK